MMTKKKDGRAVPFGRLSRFARFGGMAASVAGGMVFDGVQQLASGKRLNARDLFMTPTNALKVTNQLANMRGAAMKIGQMLSMDTGDFLPREFADILAQLRSDAQHMPRKQLETVLVSDWGEDWEAKFETFSYHPIAAASIGQVHRALTLEGEILAIKIQYPGVRESIDSDVDNVQTLLRMSRMIPEKINIDPMLEEAKRQLHQEADYKREAEYLQYFAKRLDGDDTYEVPRFHAELSSDNILAMSYAAGVPIDEMVRASQNDRNKIATMLIDLLMRELFEFQVMQTDPNFANYLYNKDSKHLVLLDFGASRKISDTRSDDYRMIMRAILSGDREAALNAARDVGFVAKDMPSQYQDIVMEMIDMLLEPLQHDRPFDFASMKLSDDLRNKSMDMAFDKELWHLPPVDTIFIQRKLGGVFMLANRLNAKVNVRKIIERYI